MSHPQCLVTFSPVSISIVHTFNHVCDAIVWFSSTVGSFIHTLFLFTYADYKTIFIPISIFAAVAAPVHSLAHFLQALMWIWVHLLQCNISNQYKSTHEDMINRPWRPIPSGRISLADAKTLRLMLVPLCLAMSSIFGRGVVATSTGLMSTMVVYDELGLAGHWIGKNLCNVFGYITFEMGATMIMGSTPHLDHTAGQALLYSACVIFTTIQAQDFADVVGDAEIGRVTFPIYAPSFSRVFTLFAMAFWSGMLSAHWSLGLLSQIMFSSLGAYIGWRYYALRTSKADSRSYLIYNLWLFMAHLLPSHARWNVLSI